MSSSKEEALRELKAEIRSLILSTTASMRLNDLVRDYKDRNGCLIKFQDYGHSSLLNFLKIECTDVVLINDTGYNPVLHPYVTDATRHINNLISKQKITNTRKTKRISVESMKTTPVYIPSGDKIPKHEKFSVANNYKNSIINNTSANYRNGFEKISTASPDCYKNTILNNLKALINEHPDGIWSTDLLNEYSKKFKSKLDYNRLGFDSVISFCRKLDDIFVIYRPSPMSDWKLYHRNCDIEDIRRQYMIKIENTVKLEKKTFDDDALPGIPIDPSLYHKDCLGYSDIIQRSKLPTLGDKLEVYVTEVLDPSHFWFNINSVNHSDALLKLMNDIDKCYKETPNAYKVTKAMVRVGQYCAAPYNNIYHRALVVFNVDEHNTKVFYVDYGTVDIVKIKDIRLLKKEFAQLPTQSLRGRLFGVEPNGKKWSSEESEQFINHVKDKYLDGIVENVENDIFVTVLNLVDISNGDKHVYINKELKSAGLAKFIENDTKSRKDREYLLPSFDDIENGREPIVPETESTRIRPLNIKLFEEIDKMELTRSNSQSENVNFNERDDKQYDDIPRHNINTTYENEQWYNPNSHSVPNQYSYGQSPNMLNPNIQGYNMFTNPSNVFPPNPLNNFNPLSFNAINPLYGHQLPFIPQHITPQLILQHNNLMHMLQQYQMNSYNYIANERNPLSAPLISQNNHPIGPENFYPYKKTDESNKTGITNPDNNCSKTNGFDTNSDAETSQQTGEISFVTHIDIGGKSLELWELKYKKNRTDYSHMVLIIEEVSFSLILPQESIYFIDDMYTKYSLLNFLCVHHEKHVTPIKRNFMENGHSGINIGDKLNVDLVTDDKIDNNTHLVLLPLNLLVQRLFQHKSILQIEMRELIKDTTKIMQEHIKPVVHTP